MWLFCPSRGKRAAEMACGKIIEVCKLLFNVAMSKVVGLCSGLSEIDSQSVLAGFSEARAMLVAVLTLKTQFWVTLPWKLAGLFHWDRDTATQCAKECLSQFQRQPVDEQHHRITVEFLSADGGLWRTYVEQLSQGISLLTLPVRFLKRCAELGLVPIVERLMEQRHATVTQRLLIGPRKRRAPTVVSLGAGRMQEIECRLSVEPKFSKTMSDNVSLMRNPKQALTMFGLTLHPRVASQCRTLDQHAPTSAPARLPHCSSLWPGLSDVVYRLTGDDQFRSTTTVTQAISKQQLETAKLKRKLQSESKQQSLGSRVGHMRALMRAHLVQECQQTGPGFLYSLRCSTSPDSDFQICVSALEDHMTTAIGQTAPRVPPTEPQAGKRAVSEVELLDEMEAAFNDDLEASPVAGASGQLVAADPDACHVQEVIFKDAVVDGEIHQQIDR